MVNMPQTNSIKAAPVIGAHPYLATVTDIREKYEEPQRQGT